MKDLEFLPDHHILARQSQRLRFIRMWLLAILALSMICWGYYGNAKVQTARAELAALETQLQQLDTAKLKARLADLTAREERYRTHAALVAQLSDNQPRSALVREVTRRLAEQLVLTRFEIDRITRDAQLGQGLPVPPPNRPGGNGQPQRETVDRLRIEGFAADDMALTRFLENMNESATLQRGELAFSKNALFRDREVRVFASTFFAAVTGDKVAQAGVVAAGGTQP